MSRGRILCRRRWVPAASGWQESLRCCGRGLLGFPALCPCLDRVCRPQEGWWVPCRGAHTQATGRRFLFRHLHFPQPCSSWSWWCPFPPAPQTYCFLPWFVPQPCSHPQRTLHAPGCSWMDPRTWLGQPPEQP